MTRLDELDLAPYFASPSAPAEASPEAAAFDPKLPVDLFVVAASSAPPAPSDGAGQSLSFTLGAPRAHENDALEPGTVVDKYRIDRLLGAGGFSWVYRATHLLMSAPVALKLLKRRALKRMPDLAQALCDEARLAARVTHPNVVRVLDVTHTPALTYLVLELVEGGSLADALKQRRLTASEVVRVGLDVAEGLGAALERGLIHRDVKPGNIFLTASGMAKLGDLGLARLDHGRLGGSFFDSKGLVGTPGYMAPEQSIDSRVVDFRADMYSLGVTLFHAAVGAPPFPLEDRQRALELHRTTPPPRPSALVPGFPPALERVILRLLAKSPSQRYDSYAALLGELRSI